MSALTSYLHILSCLLLLILFIAIPGYAAARTLRLRCRDMLDFVLICFGLGIAWSSFCVHALLLVGLYTRFSALLIVLVPICSLFWNRKHDLGIRLDRPTWPPGLSAVLNLLATLVALVLISFWFLEASTTPITAWDANISWDKWATEWAHRSNSYRYVTGGYPQLLPTFISILYKLSGTAGIPLPLEQYAAHAFHPIAAGVLLVAMTQLARNYELPIWTAILFTFGNKVLCSQVTTGGADILVVCLFCCTVAVFRSYQNKKWTCRYGAAAIVLPLIMAAGFTKAGGLMSIFFIVSMHLHAEFAKQQGKRIPVRDADDPKVLPEVNQECSRIGLFSRLKGALLKERIWITAVVPLAAYCCFFFAQTLMLSILPPEAFPANELHFNTRNVARNLQTTTQSVNGGREHRVVGGWRLLLESYPVKKPFFIPATIVLLVAVCGALFSPVRPLVLPVCATYAIWLLYAAYDVRNLLPAVPFLGLFVAGSAGVLFRILQTSLFVRITRSVLAAAVAVLGFWFLIMPEFRAYAETGMPGAALDRFAKLAGADSGQKIAAFFPEEYPNYEMLSSFPMSRKAGKIVSASHLYRWFPNGSYPLRFYSWKFTPGDILVGTAPFEGRNRPPNYGMWTIVYQDSRSKIWLLDAGLRAVPLSELTITGAERSAEPNSELGSAIGTQILSKEGMIAYNVPERGLKKGAVVLWRIILEATTPPPQIKPACFLYDNGIIDQKASRTAIDELEASRGVITYSGSIVFTGKKVSGDLKDKILVGLAGGNGAGAIHIREFAVAIHR